MADVYRKIGEWIVDSAAGPRCQVALASMRFASHLRRPIQLGLLIAIATLHRFRAGAFHLDMKAPSYRCGVASPTKQRKTSVIASYAVGPI